MIGLVSSPPLRRQRPGRPSQRSAEFAASEAERHGLTKQGDANGTYQDKIWERTANGVILRLKWHCYQPHAYRALPDMNVLSLELQQGDKVLRRVEHRYLGGCRHQRSAVLAVVASR
jgi:hypothetical protein